MDSELSGLSRVLIILGLAALLLSAVAAIMFMMPTPAWLDSESAILIPFAFVVFTVLGLACVLAGLVVGRSSAKRQSRV